MATSEVLAIADLQARDIDACLKLSDEAGWNQNADDWSLFIAAGAAFGVRDESGALIATAAAASLASLAFVMQKSESVTPTSLLARIVVTGVTIFVSWIFVHATFAIRYAHYFYGDPGAKGRHRGGLVFPGTEHPDLWDFVYYSFVVGMTCQVSDVQVTSGAMRKLTLAHGVFAFFFNAGVLALAVNILATAL